MKPTYWLATHGSDLDGISCGALVMRIYSDHELKISYLSVHEAQQSEEHFDLCTDLPKSPKAKRNIDHHSTNLEYLKRTVRLSQQDIIDPSAPSAAALVFQAFKMDSDPIAKQILALANSADTAKLHLEYPQYRIIEEIIRGYPFDQKILYELTKRFSTKGMEILDDSWVRKKHEGILEELNQSRAILRRFFSTNPIPEFLILDFVDLVPTKFYKETFGPAFYAGAKVLAVLYENPRDNSFQVSFRVHNELRGKVDVRRIAEELGGGGHPMAAGARGKDRNVLLEDVQRAFQELLPKVSENWRVGVVRLEC